MKILHVIEILAPRYGGPVSVVRSLASAQVAAGHKVSVATTNAQYPKGKLSKAECEALNIPGVEIHFCNIDFEPLKFSLEFHSLIHSLIRTVDVVHVHGFYRYPPTYAAWLARRKGIPFIITPHGNLDPFMHGFSKTSLRLKRLYELMFDLPNLRGASAIHYTTEDERNRSSFLGLKTQSFVVPNGIDWQQFETLPSKGKFRSLIGLEPEKKLVLFLGRLHFKKGLDLLIPAFAKVRVSFPEAHLAIVGPDNDGYGTEVRNLVHQCGQNSAVTFVDMLAGSAVIQAYVDADLFVLSSYVENFGITVIEALASGTPVIISDQVNIFREVAASGAGLVTRCDVSEITAALASLLHSSEHGKRMGEQGRKWVRENYSWSMIEIKFESQYRSIARL